MLDQNRVMGAETATGEPMPQTQTADLALRQGDPPEVVTAFANSNLTAAQVLALRALVDGASLNDAATAAGIERNTLYRWRTRNPQFIAAMNAWRWEQLEHGRDQFLLLHDSALAAVKQGLDSGDARLGMRVLDRMDASALAEIGPTQPTLIESPDIERSDAEIQWKSLEQRYGDLPADVREMIPGLIDLATRIAKGWGMELLDELAQVDRARQLSPAQAKRVPYIIVTAMDAADSLAQTQAAGKEGVP